MECSVEGCKSPVKSKGMCQKHYFRMWRNGTLKVKRPIREHRGICTVADCKQPDTGPNGLCHKHLARLKRNGSPLVLRGGPKIYMGPDHASWLGNNVKYGAVHCRLRRSRGSAKSWSCIDCSNPARHWSYNHNDPNGLVQQGISYSPNIDHYSPRCVPCHKRFDLRRLGKALQP